MKLATFQVSTPIGRFNRIGAVQSDSTLIDLTSSYATLKLHEGEDNPYPLTEALAPPDMKRFIEAGPTALIEAGRSVDFVLSKNLMIQYLFLMLTLYLNNGQLSRY